MLSLPFLNLLSAFDLFLVMLKGDIDVRLMRLTKIPVEGGLQLPKRQETFSCLFVSRRMGGGDSERRLNELQRLARAMAISADPTATGAQREKRRDSRMEAQR